MKTCDYRSLKELLNAATVGAVEDLTVEQGKYLEALLEPYIDDAVIKDSVSRLQVAAESAASVAGDSAALAEEVQWLAEQVKDHMDEWPL